MPTAGVVAELWRYPVKSMGGERLARAHFGVGGVPGDRGWTVHELATGRPGSGKRLGKLMLAGARTLAPAGEDGPARVEISLPGQSPMSVFDRDASARLTGWLGQAVELRPETHFDAHPVHLVTTSSLIALRHLLPGSILDARRFRPNLVVSTPGGEGFVENGWHGRLLRIGAAVLRVVKPTKRCVMTTLSTGGLPADPEVLQALVRAAGQTFGVYCAVLDPGDLSEGLAVELE